MHEKMKRFVGKFTVLKTAPRELWATYAAYTTEIIAYGLMTSAALVLWLSSDLGFNDSQAGYVIAVWSTIMSLAVMLSGSFADAIGIKNTFMLGFGIALVCRFVMVFVTAKWIVLPFGLFTLAIGLAMTTPVMNAAVRRFSNTAQRSMAFSLYYTLMNVGFAVAGWLLDYLRRHLGEHGSYTLPVIGATLSTYRMLFLFSALFTIPAILFLLLIRKGVEVSDEGVVITPQAQAVKADAGNVIGTLLSRARATAKTTAEIFVGVWRQAAFHKFLMFLALVVCVRLIYYHMSFTFPKYGIRELGEGAPIGRLFGMLNAVCVVLLVPVIGALTQRFAAYRMVIFGSFLSALSIFFLTVPPQLFDPLAQGWFGHLIAKTWLGVPGDVINPLYVAITLSVLLYSVGESFWSPRLYEYAAAIAPKGQEASYMALSTLPMFVAKFFVGMLSGVLLAKFCPAAGPRDSGTLWLIIGLMALITPLGLILLRKYIQVHEAGRD